jgi:hypothetical protein
VRTVAGLRADLRALESQLGEFGDLDDLSPGARLMFRGLSQVKEDLHTDLLDARRARLDVVLQGLPVSGHEVRVDALARLLHSLQESVSSVAQAMIGKATARASIPGPLRDATALRLSGVFAGSFGATLRGPILTDDDEVTLFELDAQTETLMDLAVEKVLDVLALASDSGPIDDAIVEAVLPLGARSYKHLKELSAAIIDEEMSAQIDFASPAVERRTAILDKRVARSLGDALGRTRITEDQEVMVGHLGTVSDIRNRVELQTADKIISARVPDEVVPELARFYSRRVSATFDVTIARSLVTGEERRSYLLVGLADATEPTLPTDD